MRVIRRFSLNSSYAVGDKDIYLSGVRFRPSCKNGNPASFWVAVNIDDDTTYTYYHIDLRRLGVTPNLSLDWGKTNIKELVVNINKDNIIHLCLTTDISNK